MLLSSVRRLKLHCAGDSDLVLSDSLKNNRTLSLWLSSVSSQFENYLSRKILLDQYVDYWDIKHSKMEYWAEATPILSLIDVFEDPRSLWIGYEREIQYAYIQQYKNSFVMPFAFSYVAQRSLRVRYFGGMARDPVISRYSASVSSGTLVAGKFLIGAMSGAVGLTSSFGTGFVNIENYYGIFSFGETVNQYDDELGTGSSSAVIVISKYPELWLTSRSGSFTVGKYLKGRYSGAIAQIVTLNGGVLVSSLTISPISGLILENEPVDEYDDAVCTSPSYVDAATNNTVNALVGYVENRALCEAFPDLTAACEMQIRYMRKHMLDFENEVSQKNATTRRGANIKGKSFREWILPEAELLLQPYRKDYGF